MWPTTRLVLLLAVILVAGLATTACPAAPTLDTLRPWNPSLSSQGQADYDARLDKPVQFWQPGVTLAEVFAGMEKQTGVTVGFFPADDENQRVRVHVFLNQQEPPTLRSLLVQLAWVTECSFSVAEEDGQKAYYLMATSVGRGAGDALESS